MDRRQVHHVEAELGELAEAAPPRRRSRPRSAGIAHTTRRSEPARARRRSLPPAACGWRGREPDIARRPRAARDRARGAPLALAERGIRERRRGRLEQLAILAAGACRSLAKELPALDELAREVALAGSILRSSSSRQVACASVHASTVHCQRPWALTSKDAAQRSPPTSASVRRIGVSLHDSTGAPVAHDRAQQVVAVAEDRGADLDAVADARLDGIASAVEQRLGILDLDPGWQVGGGGGDTALLLFPSGRLRARA